MVKRTFSIPDEKEEVYEKFKAIVPEVSSALMELIEGVVRKHEAIQAKMEQQKVFKGSRDPITDVFVGQEFRFYGVEIAPFHSDGHGTSSRVFLTKKGKYLVEIESIGNAKEDLGFTVYETYETLATHIPGPLLEQCQSYLNINSNVRTYVDLDI